jgi:D-alanine-D-alanine ligase
MREALPPRHVVVLKGGPSEERAVSLRSGTAVAKALREAGYRVTELELEGRELPQLPHDTDVVFPALHGPFGEDGEVQRLLEERGLPYVGSGVEASALIMDKQRTKAVVRAAGVPTPAAVTLTGPQATPPPGVRFPLVVKPNHQGSTIGMMRLRQNSGWWRRALRGAFAVDAEVFVEEFVQGDEITVGLLHGKALPVVQIVPPKGRMFDYDAKYDHKRGHTQYLCPPSTVSEAVQSRARELAEKAFVALGARDMLRCDFIVAADGVPWFLEANSIPGFTATSLLPMASRQAGIEFPELCARLVRGHLRG